MVVSAEAKEASYAQLDSESAAACTTNVLVHLHGIVRLNQELLID